MKTQHKITRELLIEKELDSKITVQAERWLTTTGQEGIAARLIDNVTGKTQAILFKSKDFKVDAEAVAEAILEAVKTDMAITQALPETTVDSMAEAFTDTED